jgi:hypothetical protein
MTYMDIKDAYDLAVMRMEEDKIGWAEAYKEFRSLTGMSMSSSMVVGRKLQEQGSANMRGELE